MKQLRVSTLVLLVGFLALRGAGSPSMGVVVAQQAPALGSEDLLRLVLPRDAAGERPKVLYWARFDDASLRDGSPVIFVVALYKTAAGFGQTDLRRLANEVRWDGRQYTVTVANDPGQTPEDELRWFGAEGWTMEIAAASNRSEGNPIYTVNYRGSGVTTDGFAASVTLTELFRPAAGSLWRRVTDLTIAEAATNTGYPSSVTSVTYRFAPRDRATDQLIARVVESARLAPPGAENAPQVVAQQVFIETYEIDAHTGRYRLVTRVPEARP